MTLFELNFEKFFLQLESIVKSNFISIFLFLKTFVFLFSLVLSVFLLYVWIKLEIKNRDEIDFWKFIIKTTKDFYFIKSSKKSFEEIKKKFYQDKLQGLIEINNLLNLVLETFGYQGSLDEKLKKINKEILPSLEETKKAVKIVEILKEKKEKGEEINLDEEEYFMIFHQYEIALKDLNILTTEDFLVNFSK